MQPTTRFPDSITTPILHEAYLIFHPPITLHPTDRVFDTDADGRDQAMVGFLRWGEFTPTWLFLGLDDRDTLAHKALEAHLLLEVTAAWQGITGQLREAFLMVLAFHRVTQEADVTGLLAHEQVFDRVTRDCSTPSWNFLTATL